MRNYLSSQSAKVSWRVADRLEWIKASQNRRVSPEKKISKGKKVEDGWDRSERGRERHEKAVMQKAIDGGRKTRVEPIVDRIGKRGE